MRPGRVLEQQREKAGLEPGEVAAKLKCDTSYVRRIELGERDQIKFDRLKKWCQLLNISADKVLGLKVK